MINIFGKLYTLLRRPQPEQAGEARSQDEVNEGDQEAVEMKQKGQADPMTASSEWEHVPGTAEGKESGRESVDTLDPDIVDIQAHPFLTANDSGTNVDKPMRSDLDPTESNSQEKSAGNETLDMNELMKLVGEMSSAETTDKPENMEIVTVTETGKGEQEKESKTSSEKGTAAVSGNQKEDKPVEKTRAGSKSPEDKPVEKTRAGSKSPEDKGEDKQKKKVCHYFRRGQKCWKGNNCPFEHVRKCKSFHGDAAPVGDKPIRESAYHMYGDFVEASTAHNKLVDPKDLLYKLGYQKDMNAEVMGEAVIGQYKIAAAKNYWYWVKDARYYAELFFSMDWINENLPPQGRAGKQKKQKQKKHHVNAGNQSEIPKEECRDFRIKENPNIKVYTANAAGDGELSMSEIKEEGEVPECSSTASGDGPVPAEETTDKGDKLDGFISGYAEQVLQQAMKKAIEDGLSDSLIMEVIEDVTTVDTPRKRGKVAKVDLSRTPQKRPEQLALGFNFHSDLLVKESPKTVDGGIICLDTLPPPREPVEKLAFGFNYHADVLVKESPVAENGQVLVPGVPTTPRRKARDQLALGFNYHSNLLAKTTPEIEAEKLLVHTGNDSTVYQNGYHGDDAENRDDTPSKLIKRSKVKDAFAVGFSYNSDQLMKQTLEKVNGNLHDTEIVSSIIEDASFNEKRNLIEINVEEASLIANTPAGSVW